jgi:hypothetical protein
MQNADIIFGVVTDGQASVYDMFSTGIWGPHPEDTELGGSSDISVFGGSETDGYTVIEFQRALDTGDADYDHTLVPGDNSIIWAFGTGDSLTIQHSTRGSGSITID